MSKLNPLPRTGLFTIEVSTATKVMHMMSATPYTRETLIAAIAQRFGADARFHTCSATDLSAAELVDLLAARGKFVPADGGFTTQANKICRH
ncbi:YecH family protein [Edwardsiella tarda]